MRIRIYNLHNMCENNTLFLSRAWRYFQLNGHTVTDVQEEVDLVFVGGCVVTDLMRSRCEQAILKSMQQLREARFVIFGCLAAFPNGLQSTLGRDVDRLHIIPYRASHELEEVTGRFLRNRKGCVFPIVRRPPNECPFQRRSLSLSGQERAFHLRDSFALPF